MARVSIYVSDEQKAEMDKLDSEANWSNVAQAAFDREIKRLKWPEGTNMETVIERLRASKALHETSQQENGYEAGRNWAMAVANYAELKAVGSMDLAKLVNNNWTEGDLWVLVNRSLGDDSPGPGSLFFDDDTGEAESDEYVQAFIEGAQNIWNEVADKI